MYLLLDRTTYVNFIYNYKDDALMSIDDISRETQLDPLLSQVCRYTQSGWPIARITDNDSTLKPYFMCRSELAIEKSCLVRGYKVVDPTTLRLNILQELHRGHLGRN